MATVDSQERYRAIAAEINGEPYTQPAESKITQGDIKIPYIAFESVQARSERHIKRLTVIVITLIAILFLSNALWLWVYSGYDFETYEYEQDGSGINIIGDENKGVRNYGAESEDPENNA